MPRGRHDPIKAALGDLVIKSLKQSIQSQLYLHDAAQEPLEDCVIEVLDITDTEAMVKVVGHGELNWYTVRVNTHRTP